MIVKLYHSTTNSYLELEVSTLVAQDIVRDYLEGKRRKKYVTKSGEVALDYSMICAVISEEVI